MGGSSEYHAPGTMYFGKITMIMCIIGVCLIPVYGLGIVILIYLHCKGWKLDKAPGAGVSKKNDEEDDDCKKCCKDC